MFAPVLDVRNIAAMNSCFMGASMRELHRHAIVGWYRDLGDSAPSDVRIAELLGAIDADLW